MIYAKYLKLYYNPTNPVIKIIIYHAYTILYEKMNITILLYETT